MIAALHPPTRTGEAARIDGERRSQRLVTAFVISGLVFMLMPGVIHSRHRVLFAYQDAGRCICFSRDACCASLQSRWHMKTSGLQTSFRPRLSQATERYNNPGAAAR
jgi:hypothetical protein